MAHLDTAMIKYKRVMIALYEDGQGAFNAHNKEVVKGLRNNCLEAGHTLKELQRLDIQARNEASKKQSA